MADENKPPLRYARRNNNIYLGISRTSLYAVGGAHVFLTPREFIGLIDTREYDVPARSLSLTNSVGPFPDVRSFTNINLNTLMVDLLIGGSAGVFNYPNAIRMLTHLANGEADLNPQRSILPYQVAAPPSDYGRWLAALLAVGMTRIINTPIGLSHVAAFQTIILTDQGTQPRGIEVNLRPLVRQGSTHNVTINDLTMWIRSIDFSSFMLNNNTGLTNHEVFVIIRLLHVLRYGMRANRKATRSGTHQQFIDTFRAIPIGNGDRTIKLDGINYNLHEPQMDETSAALSAMLVYIAYLINEPGITLPNDNDERWEMANEVFNQLQMITDIPNIPQPVPLNSVFRFVSTIQNQNIHMLFSFMDGLPQGGVLVPPNSTYWVQAVRTTLSWAVILPDQNFPYAEHVTYGPLPVSLTSHGTLWAAQGEALSFSVIDDTQRPNVPALRIMNATRGLVIADLSSFPLENVMDIPYQYY